MKRKYETPCDFLLRSKSLQSDGYTISAALLLSDLMFCLLIREASGRAGVLSVLVIQKYNHPGSECPITIRLLARNAASSLEFTCVWLIGIKKAR
jgi:hypothetical protein